jgi:hypothetical protein
MASQLDYAALALLGAARWVIEVWHRDDAGAEFETRAMMTEAVDALDHHVKDFERVAGLHVKRVGKVES